MRTPTFRQRVIRANDNITRNHELTPSMADWARQYATDHIAYYRDNKNGKYVCLDCGHEWVIKGKSNAKQVTCPHCGQVLDVVVSRKSTYRAACYMIVPQCHDNMQVLRVFEHIQSINLRKDWTNNNSSNIWGEVVRRFICNDHREVRTTSRAMYMSWNNLSPWRWGSELKLRTPSGSYYTHRDRVEDTYSSVIAPVCPLHGYIKEEYEKRGISFELLNTHHVSLADLMRHIERHPPIETMLKAGYIGMAQRYAALIENHHYGEIPTDVFWTAMKIVIRNKYHIEDEKMWLDYIFDLHKLGRDIHNAHYVCPTDLMAAHQATIEERLRREERERRERERRQYIQELADAAKHEAEYRKQKGRYFGIAFGEDTQHLQIAVIKSVADMKEEGRAMHHCVGGYWCHKDALILSCRYADGRRLATIEVNLKDFHIVQTRGVCNAVPEHKDLINATIMAHMDEIRRAKSTRRKAAPKAKTKTAANAPAQVAAVA